VKRPTTKANPARKATVQTKVAGGNAKLERNETGGSPARMSVAAAPEQVIREAATPTAAPERGTPPPLPAPIASFVF
jgi:hypothetical protein